MGSYEYGYGVPLKVPVKGSIGLLGFRVLGVVMSSCNYGYKSPNVGYDYSYLTYNPTYNCP